MVLIPCSKLDNQNPAVLNPKIESRVIDTCPYVSQENLLQPEFYKIYVVVYPVPNIISLIRSTQDQNRTTAVSCWHTFPTNQILSSKYGYRHAHAEL